jgi:hypothetical protein
MNNLFSDFSNRYGQLFTLHPHSFTSLTWFCVCISIYMLFLFDLETRPTSYLLRAFFFLALLC